jgi:hypothetical protein
MLTSSHGERHEHEGEAADASRATVDAEIKLVRWGEKKEERRAAGARDCERFP